MPEGTVKWHLNKARNELKEGITISQFSFEDGIDLYLQKLISEDLAVMTDGRLHLTARGMLVDNYITSDLLLYLK